jgi:transposase
MMVRRQNAPLRAVTADEQAALEQIVRASSERAECVARAKALLAVAAGATFVAAARAAGRRSGDAVAQLVIRFNKEGLAAVTPRHGGGVRPQYQAAEQERILREFRRPPDRDADGTATWSLSTLRRALRRAPDGLPAISTWTIRHALHEAGYTWQASRSWCPTGVARRKRRDGTVVQTVDPDATAKRGRSSGRIA